MTTLQDIKSKIPPQLYNIIKNEGIEKLRPAQSKAIKAGLLKGNNLLICTPTASGKTLTAELAALTAILNKKGKAIYIVPLKALASEKNKEFKRKYSKIINVAMSIGDLDAADTRLNNQDFIICTSEKLDSLARHHASWLSEIATIIVDEIHLLNDPHRGPTLEILITMLREMLPKTQIIGLSATIGNEKELAKWLDAKLVHDTWRPVTLHKGVYFNGKIDFVEEKNKQEEESK